MTLHYEGIPVTTQEAVVAGFMSTLPGYHDRHPVDVIGPARQVLRVAAEFAERPILQPNLGLASTKEMLDELIARVDCSSYSIDWKEARVNQLRNFYVCCPEQFRSYRTVTRDN